MQIRAVDGFVGQILGSYRVERLLGQSRLNAVYLARNLSTQGVDALTFYRVPEHFSREAYNRFLERFLQEAASLSSLTHRHILPIYAYGESGGNPYLITPYMMNGSLANLRKPERRFSHGQALEVLEQVASGLDYAHKQGHVHGTLRPANIVLSREGSMLVAGFGLLRMLRASDLIQGQASHLLSISGTFLAAPEYIAPEMVQDQQIDVRTDVYALGAILFELLCGKAPFSGSDPMSIAKQHVTQPAPSLRSFCPEVPVAMESVINQALERDPARRFQRVSDLVEAFAQVSVGATGHLKVISMRSEQETPENDYSTTHWQLTPPIVTGQFPTVKPTGPLPQEEDNRSGSWQLRPPIVTGQIPVVRLPDVPQEQPARRSRRMAAGPVREHRIAASVSAPEQAKPVLPEDERGSERVQPFSWWSMPGSDQEMPVRSYEAARHIHIPQSQPTRLYREPESVPQVPHQTSQRALRLGSPDMAMQPLAKSRLREPERPNRVGRRKVLSVLVTGGAIAAGLAITLNLGNIASMAGKFVNNASNGQIVPSTSTKVSNQAITNGIGRSNMALNSFVDFVNPTDQKPSLLVHMPDGHYVAYEKACTHEGVFVRYDAGTHTLVCPAHGAIFDPADGGKVLQGPAVNPLPQVKVHVQADGTIVAG